VNEWKDEARCLGLDTEAFFTDSPGPYEYETMLKKICASCEVRTQCMEYALHNDVQGWWAGTNYKQRSFTRRQLNIVPKPVYMEERVI